MIDFFEIVEKRSKCHATWMTPITLSSQCFLLCHPSASSFVIPVLRHWDLGILIVSKHTELISIKMAEK
ncbi:hypothetical protein [Wolbachia endosymbiont (group A) of Ophion ellenae]|uniref:hypothetical protein n=1 Tax=Wolbachia endosymbiont (group A) of Ophion ellenae TaxID=3066210 RepID=UPI0030D0A18F